MRASANNSRRTSAIAASREQSEIQPLSPNFHGGSGVEFEEEPRKGKNKCFCLKRERIDWLQKGMSSTKYEVTVNIIGILNIMLIIVRQINPGDSPNFIFYWAIA